MGIFKHWDKSESNVLIEKIYINNFVNTKIDMSIVISRSLRLFSFVGDEVKIEK